MEGEIKVYSAWNKVSETAEDYNKMSHLYNEEFLNSIEGYGLPPHQLRTKIGAIVMLIRNLNIKKGLCNGTRLQIIEAGQNIIKARILTGRAAGEVALIPRIRLNPDESKFDFKMVRTQFPLLPAFAMTINKSQGQSFDKVGVSLDVPVFSHGQLYVAFSRVRSKEGLRIYIKEGSNQGKIVEGKDDVYTINVVYKQVVNYTS
jgi:ATP-dependent DNA helicase PIF1